MLERLGINPIRRATLILGDSRVVECDIGRTWIRVDGNSEITLVVFGDEQLGAVLGAYSLEGLQLGVDP
jgi:predicted aspartyl protease